MKINRLQTSWLLPLGAMTALVLLAVVGAVAYDQLTGGPAQASPQEPPELETTAVTALKTASKKALEWQEDGELVGAVAHCPDIGLQAGDVDWAFQFYSPSTHHLALVVTTKGEPRLLRDVLSPYSVSTIPRRRWRIDSDGALKNWWERGGNYLVTRRPDTDLTLRLDAARNEGDEAVWTVIGSIPDQASDFVVRTSGLDGHVLEE